MLTTLDVKTPAEAFLRCGYSFEPATARFVCHRSRVKTSLSVILRALEVFEQKADVTQHDVGFLSPSEFELLQVIGVTIGLCTVRSVGASQQGRIEFAAVLVPDCRLLADRTPAGVLLLVLAEVRRIVEIQRAERAVGKAVQDAMARKQDAAIAAPAPSAMPGTCPDCDNDIRAGGCRCPRAHQGGVIEKALLANCKAIGGFSHQLRKLRTDLHVSCMQAVDGLSEAALKADALANPDPFEPR